MDAQGLEKLRREALADALPRVGEYLEKRVEKSDLFQMTEEEVLGFLEVVVLEYRDSIRRLTEAPF